MYRSGLRRTRNTALAGVSLDVASGTTLGLVGPNGSGKSTLLRLFAGVDRPTSGDIEVLGGPANSQAARLSVRFLPDGSPFPGELTGRQALRLIASLSADSRSLDRDACDSMLTRVGLSPTLKTPLRGYSRGMHRRFGLAQAFLGSPAIVLLDEPTAGLDAPGFPVLAGLIQSARARGATIVLASHVASDLIDHCDRLALLENGRLSLEGTPDELLAEPGSITMTVRGLSLEQSGDAEERTQSALSDLGATDVSARPKRRSLIDLYDASDPADRSQGATGTQ